MPEVPDWYAECIAGPCRGGLLLSLWGAEGGIMRVLGVDDHEEAVRPLAKFLEAENFDVCIAFDGASAIRTALAFHPDVVLLDIRMPAISGIDIAKLLRQLPRFDSVALVAITGHDDVPTREQMEDAGI